MINKIVSNSFDWGEPGVQLANYYLPNIKTAALPEAKKYLDSLKADDEKFYVLVVALGAGEYWGSNKNGDYFPESELINSYRTFEQGHAFIQHQNSDPQNAVGRVLKAFWNDKMKRVELIVEVSRSKASDILERLKNGETIDVSMGCKVDYDVCSICGHKSKNRLEYCYHLRSQMNAVLPDGRQVYAINPNPVFFDISFVRRGADPTAKVLEKVASVRQKQAEKKQSEIEKEVDAQGTKLIAERSSDWYNQIEQAILESQDMPPQLLEELCEFPLGDVVTTFTLLGVPLKPNEIAKLVGALQYLQPDKQVLIQLMRGKFEPKIAELASDVIKKRNLYKLSKCDVKKTASEGMNGNIYYGAYKEAADDTLNAVSTLPAVKRRRLIGEILRTLRDIFAGLGIMYLVLELERDYKLMKARSSMGLEQDEFTPYNWFRRETL